MIVLLSALFVGLGDEPPQLTLPGLVAITRTPAPMTRAGILSDDGKAIFYEDQWDSIVCDPIDGSGGRSFKVFFVPLKRWRVGVVSTLARQGGAPLQTVGRPGMSIAARSQNELVVTGGSSATTNAENTPGLFRIGRLRIDDSRPSSAVVNFDTKKLRRIHRLPIRTSGQSTGLNLSYICESQSSTELREFQVDWRTSRLALKRNRSIPVAEKEPRMPRDYNPSGGNLLYEPAFSSSWDWREWSIPGRRWTQVAKSHGTQLSTGRATCLV